LVPREKNPDASPMKKGKVPPPLLKKHRGDKERNLKKERGARTKRTKDDEGTTLKLLRWCRNRRECQASDRQTDRGGKIDIGKMAIGSNLERKKEEGGGGRREGQAYLQNRAGTGEVRDERNSEDGVR